MKVKSNNRLVFLYRSLCFVRRKTNSRHTSRNDQQLSGPAPQHINIPSWEINISDTDLSRPATNLIIYPLILNMYKYNSLRYCKLLQDNSTQYFNDKIE